MSLPPFWLKITKQHVIENFDDLIHYLKNYPYTKPGEIDNEDFRQTCKYLKSVADDYVVEIEKLNIYSNPEFDIPTELVVRILAATVFTSNILGETDYNTLAALMRLLMQTGQPLAAEIYLAYLNILTNCINRYPIRSLGYTLSDIDSSVKSSVPLTVKLSNIIFQESEQQTPPAVKVYENRGSVSLRGNQLTICDLNYAGLCSRKPRTELSSDFGITVKTSVARGRKNDIDTLLMNCAPLSGDFKQVLPSTAPRLKRYSDTDSFPVKINYISGYKIETETVDPAYESERGNVFIDNNILLSNWLPIDLLRSVLQPDDCIPVVRNSHPTMPFRLDKESIYDFLRYYPKDLLREDLRAMYVKEINGGSRWITEAGIYLNIFDIDNRQNQVADLVERARTDGLVATVRVDSFKEDEVTGHLMMKGIFKELTGEADDLDAFTEDAFKELFSEFLADMKDEMPEAQSGEIIEPADPRLLHVLATTVYHLALRRNPNDSYSRVEQLMIAMVLMHLIGADADRDFILAELNYQKAVIGFAHGESPAGLSLLRIDDIPDAPLIESHRQVIEILKSYREHIDCHADGFSPAMQRSDAASAVADVRQLVNASNSIIDKIDISEIDRIKKTICAKLEVLDEYNSICGSATNYGVESDVLEFKASCVTPPANLTTGFGPKDMEMQRWNILKTICAYLNSMNGGELLIGVSDAGNALGLQADVEYLYRGHHIHDANSDRLRQYVKNFVDHAFTTSDGRVNGTAITSELIQYSIEQTNENKEILRIIVRPYPWDVVKFAATDRPARFQEAYIRTSGASTPLSVDGMREVRMRKIKAVDKHDYKLSKIMEPIDHKVVVEIRNYFSQNGSVTKQVEPYRILHDRKAFLAYDLTCGDMRTFKFARFKADDLILTTRHWKNADKHEDRTVDLFGMMESAQTPALPVVMRLTDYAWCLMMEEYNVKEWIRAGKELKVVENRKSDDSRYPWTIELKVNHPSGIARFIMGLPGQIKLISPSELSAYIADLQK